MAIAISQMKKKILKGILLCLAFATLYLLLVIFVPRTYDVPEQAQRESTQYWDLPTGSRIGYTHLIAKGEKQPYPVIYLHGGPGGPIYDSNINILSALTDDGFDVYLYDQVGCGWSSRLDDISEYTAVRHTADLSAIIQTLGVEKVILIGQSWGAVLATLYIADYPEMVEKAIFTGPGPIFPIDKSVEKIKAPDSLGLISPSYTNKQGREKVYTLKTTIVEKLAQAFNWKVASDKEMDQFVSVLNHEMGKSTVCDTSITSPMETGSGYYAMIKTVQSLHDLPDTRPKLKDCAVPLFIMRGQCDGIKWGYVAEYSKYFNNIKVEIIPDAGHSIAREQPAKYLDHIRSFLQSS